MAATDWVGISIDSENNEILKEIQGLEHGIFKGTNSIDVLLNSAALAFEKGVRPAEEYKRNADITNKNLLTLDIQTFMCVLSYSIDKDIGELEDRTKIVRTFERYAQAGLPLLLSEEKSQSNLTRALGSIHKNKSMSP